MCYAISSGQPLRFSILASLSNALSLSDQFLTRSVVDIIQYGRSDLIVGNREFLEALELLHSISEAMTAYYMTGGGDRVIISNSIYFVEYRLSSLNYRSLRERSFEFDFPAETGRLDLAEALGIASQIYLHLGIRDVNVRVERHRRLFGRLLGALPQERNFEELAAPRWYLCLLLWIFSMGATDPTNVVAKNFHVRGMAQLCNILMVHSREDFVGCLKEVLWVNPFSSRAAEQSWEDINMLWLGDTHAYAYAEVLEE
jgi:hypothetical protein